MVTRRVWFSLLNTKHWNTVHCKLLVVIFLDCHNSECACLLFVEMEALHVYDQHVHELHVFHLTDMYSGW